MDSLQSLTVTLVKKPVTIAKQEETVNVSRTVEQEVVLAPGKLHTSYWGTIDVTIMPCEVTVGDIIIDGPAENE